jgi:hypothetical protein
MRSVCAWESVSLGGVMESPEEWRLNTAVWRTTPGFGWFAPVVLLKLLASHAAGASPEKE